MMGQYRKMFFQYGTTFAVVGLVLDAIKGNVDPYWWVDVIGAYAAAAIVALAWNWYSKRSIG